MLMQINPEFSGEEKNQKKHFVDFVTHLQNSLKKSNNNIIWKKKRCFFYAFKMRVSGYRTTGRLLIRMCYDSAVVKYACGKAIRYLSKTSCDIIHISSIRPIDIAKRQQFRKQIRIRLRIDTRTVRPHFWISVSYFERKKMIFENWKCLKI